MGGLRRRISRIYYIKGPVLIFGVFMPVFLFLAFLMGSRQLPLRIPGFRTGRDGTLFHRDSGVHRPSSPGRGRQRHSSGLRRVRSRLRLSSSVTSRCAHPLRHRDHAHHGDHRAVLGLSLLHAITLCAGILLAACCFSAIGMLPQSPHQHPVKHHDALVTHQVPAGLHLGHIHPSRTDASLGDGTRGLLPPHLLY